MDNREMANRLNLNNKRDPLWGEAFRLYKEVFPYSDVAVECRSCRQKVLKWLKHG